MTETEILVPPAGSRTLPAAAVMLLHVGLLALLLAPAPAIHSVVQVAPMFIQLIHATTPAQAIPAPPRPVMREAPRAQVATPGVSIAREVAAPADEIRPVAVSPSPPVETQRPATAPIEPPRFDLAYLANPAPAYPPISRRMREQGRVVLGVLVTREGLPSSIEVRASSGSERLDRAAFEAVRRWRFVPARRGEETISAWALVPIVFHLES